MGLTDDEIARILLDQAVDAPWIFFEPQDVEPRQIRIAHHIPGCVHKVLDSNMLETHVAVATSPDDQSHIERLVQELCGLAGVAPISKDRGKWNGHVDFLGTEQQDLLECQVSILSPGESGEDLPTSVQMLRVTRALKGLSLAMAHVQGSGLCCDSLTLLHQFDSSSESEVKMSRISFSTIHSLLGFSASELEQWDRLSLEAATQSASPNVEALRLALALLMIPHNFEDRDIQAVLYYFALLLLVQMLCLAFLSYSRGHIGPLQPCFLDGLVHEVLCGTELRLAKQYGSVEANSMRLSCLEDMLAVVVLCFSWIKPGKLEQQQAVPSVIRYDLTATAEDMIDTWGPGNLFLTGEDPGIVGFHLGGGVVCADSVDRKAENGTSPVLCHWNPYSLAIQGTSKPESFPPKVPIRVATAVTENPHCVRDQNEWWAKCSSCSEFQNLGTHHAH